MKNSMMMFIFFCFRPEVSFFFLEISSKNQNFLLKLNFRTYNQFHNILKLFDVLPNFIFTTSETMGDYYL